MSRTLFLLATARDEIGGIDCGLSIYLERESGILRAVIETENSQISCDASELVEMLTLAIKEATTEGFATVTTWDRLDEEDEGSHLPSDELNGSNENNGGMN